jgi:hypothetical protein
MRWSRGNRRLRRQTGVASWLVGVFVLLAAVGIAYVCLNGQTDMLGRELRLLEDKRSRLAKQHLNEEYRWARLKSPQSLEKALVDHRLVMGAPRHDQVVRLRDAPQSERGLLAVLGGAGSRGDGKAVRE